MRPVGSQPGSHTEGSKDDQNHPNNDADVGQGEKHIIPKCVRTDRGGESGVASPRSVRGFPTQGNLRRCAAGTRRPVERR